MSYHHPTTSHSNFYRFVMTPPTTDAAAATAPPQAQPQAVFRALPRGSVLTVRVDVPEPWNIQVGDDW